MKVWESVIEIYVYIGIGINVLSYDESRRQSVSTIHLRCTSCASCEVENKVRLCTLTYSCAQSHKTDYTIQPSSFLH